MFKAPAVINAARPSRNAAQGRRRRKYMANTSAATNAMTHHSGGRHACSPATMPAAKASAAHTMGCRGRASVTPRAFVCECKTQGEEGLPHQMKHALQMVGLGEQIHQVRLLYSISSLEQAAQVAGEGSRIA